MTATNLVYPILLVFALFLSLSIIPREKYRVYLIYGFLVGGLMDVLIVTILNNFLGIIQFKNQGIFNALGHHALAPICWTLIMALFLYLLPKPSIFLYFYILAWGLLSIGFGYIVHNVGLFDFQPWFYPFPALIIFIVWLTFAAYLFRNTSLIHNET